MNKELTDLTPEMKAFLDDFVHKDMEKGARNQAKTVEIVMTQLESIYTQTLASHTLLFNVIEEKVRGMFGMEWRTHCGFP